MRTIAKPNMLICVVAALAGGLAGTWLVYFRHCSISLKLLTWRTRRIIKNDIEKRIHVVKDEETWKKVLPHLLSEARREGAVGLDCEWTSAGGKRKPVAILQLATCSGLCVLLRLSHMDPHLPGSLRNFLEDESILKVGIATLDDSTLLAADYCLKVRGCVDLRHLAIRVEGEPEQSQRWEGDGMVVRLGLNSLSSRHLGLQLDKDFKVRTSNWDAETLTSRQIMYAAQDALAGAHLLLALCTRLWQDSGSSGDPSYPALPPPPLLPLLLPPPLWYSQLTTLLRLTCLPHINCRFKNAKKQKCGTELSSVVSKSDGAESVRLKDGKEKEAPRRYHPLLKSPLYDNCQLLAPDGVPLCTCDTKKAEWYLARGLGKEISRDPLVVCLAFEPRGRPEQGPGDDMYYVQERENVCVVCGVEEGLARKSIVPHEYRRYFPAILKEHASHDLLLLCPPCHHATNLYDLSLRQKLTEECQAMLGNSSQSRMSVDSSLTSVRSAARALLRSRAKLPLKRIQELEDVVQCHYGLLTEATLQAAAALEVRVINEDHVPHGLAVVTLYQRHKGLVSLEHRWRSHFLATSRPQHLPQDWSPSHRHHKLHALAASLPPGHPDHTLYSSLLTGTDISHNAASSM